MENTNQVVENQEVTETTAVVEETPKAAKWFEQENAFPYTEGDTVTIVANKHKGLIGRNAQVVKPSAKKNAVKAYLIKPDGELQKTLVTLDFDGIELAAKPEEVTEETTEVATA